MSTASGPEASAVSATHADLVYAGLICRQTRDRLGLSLDEVAQRAHVPRTTLADFETGTGDLLLGRLRRVLHLYGLTLADLDRPAPPSVFARVLLLLQARGPQVAEQFEALLLAFAQKCPRRRRG